MTAQPAPPGPRPRALVTGAAGGLGRAVGARLLERGWHVVAADLAPPVIPGAEAMVLDVTDDDGVVAAVAGLGLLDALVLCHGVTALGPAMQVPMAAVDRVLEVNLRGAIHVAQVALPRLVERRGRIAVAGSPC